MQITVDSDEVYELLKEAVHLYDTKREVENNRNLIRNTQYPRRPTQVNSIGEWNRYITARDEVDNRVKKLENELAIVDTETAKLAKQLGMILPTGVYFKCYIRPTTYGVAVVDDGYGDGRIYKISVLRWEQIGRGSGV